MNDKATLRKEFLEKRRALSLEDILRWSNEIRRQLITLPELQTADALLTYVSSKDNEVDTWMIIQWALNRQIQVFVPKTIPGRQLTWHRLFALSDLRRNRFGILEPDSQVSEPIPPSPSAPVLVPGIAFTPKGFRIGYGAGYFDRFLATHNGRRIGLAFDFQLIEEFPVDEHDIPVEMVVTEKRVITCR